MVSVDVIAAMSPTSRAVRTLATPNQNATSDQEADYRVYEEELDFLAQQAVAQWQPPGDRALPAPRGEPLPLPPASFPLGSSIHTRLEVRQAWRARRSRWGGLFQIKVGCIFQECDPLLDDPLERLIILPVGRNPLTVQSEARQRRTGVAPPERALAVIVGAIIAL